MKKAVVIKTVGDAEMASVMVDAVVKPLETVELAAVKAELEKTKAENAELVVRKVRDNISYNKKMRKLKRKYTPPKKPSKAGEVILVIWALIWLGIFATVDYLTEWNRK